MLVVKKIKYRGQPLTPGRLLRIEHDGIPYFQKKYKANVKFWMNWPKKPEIFLGEEVVEVPVESDKEE